MSVGLFSQIWVHVYDACDDTDTDTTKDTDTDTDTDADADADTDLPAIKQL